MSIYDMLLSNAMMGEGGGGGGSSDFSTAEVTVTMPAGMTISNLPVPTLDEDVAPDYYEGNTLVGFSGSYSVVLYKGVAYGWLDPDGGTPTVNVTGGIEYDSEELFFKITGDGTITIS